jgi:hypothetical protein
MKVVALKSSKVACDENAILKVMTNTLLIYNDV